MTIFIFSVGSFQRAKSIRQRWVRAIPLTISPTETMLRDNAVLQVGMCGINAGIQYRHTDILPGEVVNIVNNIRTQRRNTLCEMGAAPFINLNIGYLWIGL